MNDRLPGSARRALGAGRRVLESEPDATSVALQDLSLEHGTYCRCELGSPWGIEFPRQEQARFHFVIGGRAWLSVSKQNWLALRQGDVVLLPRGTGHSLASEAGGRVTPFDHIQKQEISPGTYRMKTEGNGPGAVLICCSVSFALPAVHPLLELMPSALNVPGGSSSDATLRVLLDAMATEARSGRIGAVTVMTRLADVAITHIVRAWMEAHPVETASWLAALRDPQVGRALAAIHERPGDAWSVDSLAKVANASRSVFAERFAALVGIPPARYVANWRMHVASSWLRGDVTSVAEAASRLGYDSEAAFSRAFKRFSGVSPSALRQAPRRRRAR